MLIAFIVIIGLFFVFLIASYFLSRKRYSLNVENSVVTVTTSGSKMRVFINDKPYKEYISPPLIHGVKYPITVNEKEYTLSCQSSGLGYKLKVEILDQDKVVATNGVKLKNSEKK